MATNAKTITDNLRNLYFEKIMDFFKDEKEVLKTASGTLYILTADENGEDRWVKISVIIPKADETEGTDGYSLAEEYEMKLAENEEKARIAEEKKAKKIAEAEKKKAEREAKKNSAK